MWLLNWTSVAFLSKKQHILVIPGHFVKALGNCAMTSTLHWKHNDPVAPESFTLFNHQMPFLCSNTLELEVKLPKCFAPWTTSSFLSQCENIVQLWCLQKSHNGSDCAKWMDWVNISTVLKIAPISLTIIPSGKDSTNCVLEPCRASAECWVLFILYFQPADFILFWDVGVHGNWWLQATHTFSSTASSLLELHDGQALAGNKPCADATSTF